MYKHFFKRVFDIVLSLIGAVILLPFFLIIGIIIFIDNPGPIFFRQKRVGKNKKLFWLWKFRTMKTKTPDIPTHLLEHPEQYITRVGRVLRKLSIDELPQIWQILFGKMSIIGPRPALWNQDDLIAERDKYGANNIRPGLTGWAQINGRDELEIPVKAALDGEYVRRMGFLFDCKCFFGTIAAVFKHDGVVEGGTGELHKQEQQYEPTEAEEPLVADSESQENADTETVLEERESDDSAAENGETEGEAEEAEAPESAAKPEETAEEEPTEEQPTEEAQESDVREVLD